jgi:hypothetical protein
MDCFWGNRIPHLFLCYFFNVQLTANLHVPSICSIDRCDMSAVETAEESRLKTIPTCIRRTHQLLSKVWTILGAYNCLIIHVHFVKPLRMGVFYGTCCYSSRQICDSPEQRSCCILLTATRACGLRCCCLCCLAPPGYAILMRQAGRLRPYLMLG